jgi:hypothetical protein
MSSPLLTLREVNENVRAALLRFRPELQQCSAISASEFTNLRAELLRASECLLHLDTNRSHFRAEPEEAALSQEIHEYRANLEKLKHLLPDLQMRLLAERARLGRAQVHLAAADAWAGVSEKTLQK